MTATVERPAGSRRLHRAWFVALVTMGAGWIRQSTGDYMIAWMTAGSLCLLAAGLCLNIPKVQVKTDAGLEAPITDSW